MLFGLTLGLVILIALESCFLLACAANEWPEAGLTSVAVAVVGADIFFGTGVAPWIWANPWLLVGLFAAYLTIGTGWSFFKWVTFLKRSANSARDRKKALFTKYNLTGDIGGALDALSGQIVNIRTEENRIQNGNGRGEGYPDPSSRRVQIDHDELVELVKPPQASAYKRRIMAWISTWPFSIIWFVIDEPLKIIWDWFRGSYQRLADHMWKNVTASSEP